jgi:hypothetical protein
MRFSAMLAGVAAMCVGAVSTAAMAATSRPRPGGVLVELATRGGDTGSVGALADAASFSSVLNDDGLSLTWHDTPTGRGFTLQEQEREQGEHRLAAWGHGHFGEHAHAHVRGLHAAVPVPEPESAALALVAVGVLAGSARRLRRRQP